jgi:hypothetical protein
MAAQRYLLHQFPRHSLSHPTGLLSLTMDGKQPTRLKQSHHGIPVARLQ